MQSGWERLVRITLLGLLPLLAMGLRCWWGRWSLEALALLGLYGWLAGRWVR